MIRQKADFFADLMLDFLALAISVLFFIHVEAGWSVLYVLALIFLCFSPTRLIINLIRHNKEKDPLDNLVILFDYAFFLGLLLHPDRFLYWAYVFFGWWTMGHGVISLIDFYVRIRDGQRGAPQQLFGGLGSVLLAVFMIYGKVPASKNWILSILNGIYFALYGIISLLQQLSSSPWQKREGRHAGGWAVPLPVILSALLPMRAYISVRRLLNESRLDPPKPQTKCDLQVYIYLNSKGPEALGHLDISWHNTIYSYGCHDPLNRHFFGTLGDGVLIRADRQKFLQYACHGENKIVIGYGIRLSAAEAEKLQKRIDQLMERSIPWACAAQEKVQQNQSDADCNDYVSRVWKATQADLFKFTKGKFRTYFAASTNCVILADFLLRCPELHLIDLNGPITPGAYLSFLNTQYNSRTGIVEERTLYLSNQNH